MLPIHTLCRWSRCDDRSDCDSQQGLAQELCCLGSVELTKSCSPGSAAARRHWQSPRVYRVELQKYCVVLYLQQPSRFKLLVRRAVLS